MTAPLLALVVFVASQADAPADRATAAATEAEAVAIRMLVGGLDPRADDRWTQAARDRIRSQVMTQPLVDDRVSQMKLGPSEERLDAAVAALASELTRRNSEATLDQTLVAAGASRIALRNYLRSEMGFARLLRETVTEKQIAAEFAAHRAWYDGTEVDIRQGTPAETAAAAEPPGDDSELVTLRGLQSAPRPIVVAALANEADATRGPIAYPTPDGVRHRLIRVVDRRPGRRSLEDARPLVLGELSRRLRREIVGGSPR